MHDVVPMLMFVCLAATIFAIAYFRNRENMALIDRNINPREGAGRVRPFGSLKFGLLLMGCSIGLLVAFIVDQNMSRAASMSHGPNPDMAPAYFSLIAMGGGLGLVLSYFEKKEWNRIRDMEQRTQQSNATREPLLTEEDL